MKIGIKPGDKVTVSSNRPDGSGHGCNTNGCYQCTYYPISAKPITIHFQHAEIKVLFIEGKELRTKIEPILPEIKSLKHIYTFVDQGVLPYFDQLVELGKANPEPEKLKERREKIDKMNLATIIYTSGTTGNPKGVMLATMWYKIL